MIALGRSQLHNSLMTMQLVQEEIGTFLSSQQPGVLVLAGKWGVGKTFAWNQFLSEANSHGKISLEHYSYVSLFGLGNLPDLRTAIFQNSLKRSDIGKMAGLETLEKVIESAPLLWRKSGLLASIIPGGEKYSAAFEKIGFFWVKNQIVTIDDLERKSDSLDIRDVLGLVSQLKEQRGCKVVLLLNDERFREADDKEFQEQLEKVADVILRFDPTPQEAARIGIDDKNPFCDQFRRNCELLGIVNIRTIKKIEAVGLRLHTELIKFDPRVFTQALHTLTLLKFAKLQPSEAPALSYVERLSDFSRAFEEILADDTQEPAEHANWKALLTSYDFSQMDEFDGVIYQAVRDGHINPGELQREAQSLEKRFIAADADQSFNQAWDLYHDSFDDNAVAVADALADSIKTTPNAISPMNLSRTIVLLRDLQWAGNIDDLVAGYVTAHDDEHQEFWDLSHSTFGSEVSDPSVRQALQTRLEKYSGRRDPVVVLETLARERSWGSDDVAFLATQSADDFYAIFKELRSTQLSRVIVGALLFQNIANPDVQTAELTKNALAALRRIGLESPINRRRVMRFGIDVLKPEAIAGDEKSDTEKRSK